MRKYIFLILFLFLVGCQKHPQESYSLTLRFSAPLEMNYTLELNHSIIKQGNLISGWNDLVVPEQGGTYDLYFWNKDYYADKLTIVHYYEKYNRTITKELSISEANKKGNIEIQFPKKPIPDNEATTPIYFYARNGTVKKISYCLFRSVGYIYAEPILDEAICDYWTNKTIYGNFTNHEYYCDSLVTKCKNIENMYCTNDIIISHPDIQYDRCYLLAKDLKENDGFRIDLHTKTMSYFSERDYLDIWVFDMELSPDKRVLGQQWGYNFNNLINYTRLQ